MEKVIVTKSKLDAINTAISEKSGIEENRTLDQMVTDISEISSGSIDTGANGLYKSLMSGTNLEEIEDNELTSLKAYAQYNNTNLKKIKMTEVLNLGINSFLSCSNLQIIDLPKVTVTSGYSFTNCDSLTDCYLPSLINPGGQGRLFQNCDNLQYVYLPSATSLQNRDLLDCSSLKVLDFPSLRRIAENNPLDANTIEAVILKGNYVPTLTASEATNKFNLYVNKNQISNYQYATNWVARIKNLYSIDLELNIDVNDIINLSSYVPSGAVGQWDIIQCQSYNCGTLQYSNFTAEKEGRALLRCKDARNYNIVYIIYVKIGKGYDLSALEGYIDEQSNS